MLDSLFNKFTGLETCNFIKKCLQHRCFPLSAVNFLRTAFPLTSGVCFYVYSKGKKRKAWNKGARKNVSNERRKWKKMETFHLISTRKFWCQLKQKYKYDQVNIRTAHTFYLTFSSNFLSFDFCVFIFCVFISDKLKNISCCIYQYIQKQALRGVL